VIISLGFEEGERDAIATLYWAAFGPKLNSALGPETKALRFVAAALRADHAFVARDGAGRILGVAGFRTADGALVGGTVADMARVYGWLSALRRVGVLSLLARDTENVRFLLDGIAVAERARGQGVGSRLLEAVALEARLRGYAELRLDVIEGNDRARALYERRGFAAVEEQSLGLLRHVFGFRSSTVMVRRLG
jgi:ribosomal protein S18 acetylase RimI-like enzyme